MPRFTKWIMVIMASNSSNTSTYINKLDMYWKGPHHPFRLQLCCCAARSSHCREVKVHVFQILRYDVFNPKCTLSNGEKKIEKEGDCGILFENFEGQPHLERVDTTAWGIRTMENLYIHSKTINEERMRWDTLQDAAVEAEEVRLGISSSSAVSLFL